MISKNEVKKFVKSQKSIHLYPKVRRALEEVLVSMPKEDYKIATKNLYLMVLHESALGQVMHFPRSKGKFNTIINCNKGHHSCP